MITGDDADEKVVVDKQYFDEIFRKLKASVETLEVTMDKTLMANILSATKNLSEDLREGRLLTIDEVFSEENKCTNQNSHLASRKISGSSLRFARNFLRDGIEKVVCSDPVGCFRGTHGTSGWIS